MWWTIHVWDGNHCARRSQRFSFIFADLIILPILDIYRKYYGWKMMSYILVTFSVTMAVAGYVVEFLFAALGIIPQNRNVAAITEGVQWNYTSVLNFVFLGLAAVLMIRFVRTGGVTMLKMMNKSVEALDQHTMAHALPHQNLTRHI